MEFEKCGVLSDPVTYVVCDVHILVHVLIVYPYCSCLHDWTPHGGDSVSRLMFCDNLLTSDPK